MTQILPQTLERLKIHAEPLVDTVDSVINKLLDYYEQNPNKALVNLNTKKNTDDWVGKYYDSDLFKIAKSNTIIDSEFHPNLKHSKFKGAFIDGNQLPQNLGWNGFMLWVIEYASSKLNSEDLDKSIIINHVKGHRVGDGFKYLPKVNLSVQGQNSTNAWKAGRNLIKKINSKAEVYFSFQHLDNIMNKFEINC
jgi:hypothetical protein